MTPRALVVTSLEAWDDVWRRNQHLVARLLRHDPELTVLFVEPAVDATHEMRRERRIRRGAGLRNGPMLKGVAGSRLWLYQPTKLLPRRVDPGYDARRARAILRAAEAVGARRPVIWINDPSTAALLDAGLPTLYDITDDWTAASRSKNELTKTIAYEETLLERAAEVVVCSPHLASLKGRTRAVHLVTNGVDLAAYEADQPRPRDLPPGPVALYVGTLHEDRLDVELVCRTARQIGGSGSLVLLGPDALEESSRSALVDAGVVLLGRRPHLAVPAYLQQADVLVVPHVVDAFTESLDPIKLYEYLAAGRHVVATPVAGFRDLDPDRATIADRARFADAVLAALEQDAPRLVPPDGLATWDRQSRLMAEVVARVALSGAERAP
ncbi:glycosyltransferase [Luteimicrobium subarcticum]|uniref:Glycosyltransferase involved in cell wall biosynthesis n=1 Tax=Luteimicrobium subarcticum TaxID=620910 RepID=A0A2M8WT31_9MICO|nr:glycosyltransferase [Luteimicrobium subarcticum]PJI94105.1 glycosyltransferase involved in cell wall biosynthesis [Luteimicrobium subarcticum]